MLQFDKMYTIECLLVSFIFYSLDVRFIYYSLVFFFPCIPAGGTQVLVYTAGHTMWKASEKCYPSVKRAKHFIEPKKKKKKGGGGEGVDPIWIVAYLLCDSRQFWKQLLVSDSKFAFEWFLFIFLTWISFANTTVLIKLIYWEHKQYILQ